MKGYYCGRYWVFSPRFEWVLDVEEINYENDTYKIVEKEKDDIPGIFVELWPKYPIAIYHCVPKKIVEKLYPYYRRKMPNKKKIRIIETILADIRLGRVPDELKRYIIEGVVQ